MPRDEERVDEGTAGQDNAGGAGGFLQRIPPELRGTFTDRQIAAVDEAFPRTRHGVDIRLSVPLPWGRRYVVLLAGKERRSAERRRLERLRNPLFTVMNVLAMAIIAFLVVFFAISQAGYFAGKVLRQNISSMLDF
jgi:hypothetical protein